MVTFEHSGWRQPLPAPPVESLRGLSDEQMWAVVNPLIGRTGDAAWTTASLMHPDVVEQVGRVLAERAADIHQQIEIANLDVELGDRDSREVQEWKSKAGRMRLMVQRRVRQSKEYVAEARRQRGLRYQESMRQHEREALAQLAAAVAAHQQAVADGTDTDDTDVRLWDLLDQLSVPDGPERQPTPLRWFVDTGRWTEGKK